MIMVGGDGLILNRHFSYLRLLWASSRYAESKRLSPGEWPTFSTVLPPTPHHFPTKEAKR